MEVINYMKETSFFSDNNIYVTICVISIASVSLLFNLVSIVFLKALRKQLKKSNMRTENSELELVESDSLYQGKWAIDYLMGNTTISKNPKKSRIRS